MQLHVISVFFKYLPNHVRYLSSTFVYYTIFFYTLRPQIMSQLPTGLILTNNMLYTCVSNIISLLPVASCNYFILIGEINNYFYNYYVLV